MDYNQSQAPFMNTRNSKEHFHTNKGIQISILFIPHKPETGSKSITYHSLRDTNGSDGAMGVTEGIPHKVNVRSS